MTYTEAEVDQQVTLLERGAERQIATAGSAVKGVAAERDLLSAAETSRNLLIKAVKGEKAVLTKIFGGDCERLGRLRLILDRVVMSEMHQTDPRWNNLRDACDSIEAVLQECGSYKPWKPPDKLPPLVGYKGFRRRLSPGRKVNFKPQSTGGDPESFEVAPTLPPNLELSATTGVISGMLLAAIVEEASYTVIAKNSAGECQTELIFAVKETPPTALSYPSVRPALVTGDKIEWEAKIVGGSPTEWSIEPALPSGMSLNPVSGNIKGAPAEGVDKMEYKVSCGNTGGQASTVICFEVTIAAPKSLSYPELRVGATLALKVPITLTPEAVGGTTFSVRPPLPNDLVLDESTGVISGTPTETTELRTYEIVSRNVGGQIVSNISFEVTLIPPSSLSYSLPAGGMHTGKQVALQPEVVGYVEEWFILPVLPAGLTFDTSSGHISGAAEEPVEEQKWLITGRNPGGKVTCELSFAVALSAPSELSFPAWEKVRGLLVPLTLRPRFVGRVDSFHVSPQLPPGLELDTRSGVISGTPTEVSTEESYTFAATNEAGTTSTTLEFAVKVMPPQAISYPKLEKSYIVGEMVRAAPKFQGTATSFSVKPALPPGLELDQATGEIRGAPTDMTEEAEYCITATNDAGSGSASIFLAVAISPPEQLRYPVETCSFAVDEEVTLEPEERDHGDSKYSIRPPLPDGLTFDKATGVISGAPTGVCELATYRVTVANPSGSKSAELSIEVIETLDSEEISKSINQAFAEKVELVTDIADMVEEPSRVKQYGDWMVWMVHRAWLNDPTLTELSFNNMHMPPPHLEAKIAPKLMQAMKSNTHIEVLELANSNLMKPQGHELAEALVNNLTLKSVNIEANNLDSHALKDIVQSIAENKECCVEHLRMAQQKGMGAFFGRPVEEAMGQLMESNQRIIKLGFPCNDAHWRNIIDRAVLRNNDIRRRRRQSTSKGSVQEDVQAVEKSLGRVVLQAAPDTAVETVFAEDNAERKAFRAYVAQNKKFPAPAQMQSFAKNQGTPLKYSTVAPLIRECRQRLLDAATGSEVLVVDTFEVELEGVLRRWSEANGSWELEVWPVDGGRFAYKTSKDPSFAISDAWAKWLLAGDDMAAAT